MGEFDSPRSVESDLLPDTHRAGARLLAYLPLIIAVFGFGLLAVGFGQSDPWDLRNYHLYDGWAFWTGRGAIDFAPAQVQSYFNPLLATATYLLFAHTPPWLSAFLLGVVQGANVLPLYLLARRLLPASVQSGRPWFALLVALVGAVGATQLGELGGSMGDNLVSLPVLCAFALALGTPSLDPYRAAGAGLLIGMAVGIKLTVAPFALGLMLAMPLLAWQRPQRWRILVAAGSAALLGFLAADGFWLLRLYREFGNPLHPMFASLFGGEYAPPLSLRDLRAIPQTLPEWLFYPLVWLGSPHRVSEVWFRDLRVPLAFLAMPILLWRGADADQRTRVRALALALAIAYLAWLPLFGFYRYLAPLEMLAPLLVALALGGFARHRTRLLACILLFLIMALDHPPNWGRLRAHGNFLQTDIPALPNLDRSTVVLADDEPLAFLALGFPPTAKFVRIGGNLLGPPYPVYGMDREAARRLAAAEGPIYALLVDPRSAKAPEALERQQLTLTTPCAPVHSNLLPQDVHVEICPVQRAGIPQLQ
ncbi:MAG TPA: glycosyltransferase family 87 protein [Rudaea sp.]|jgi:hypothetical protein|uniref:glycosyltransferase family 87 protein n=1 Tax=Rudaea sp. TaxID=2136325 RepID=UPI002F94E174